MQFDQEIDPKSQFFCIHFEIEKKVTCTYQEHHCFGASDLHEPTSGLNQRLSNTMIPHFGHKVPKQIACNRIPVKRRKSNLIGWNWFYEREKMKEERFFATEMKTKFRRKICMLTYFDGVFIWTSHIRMIAAQSTDWICCRATSLCCCNACSQK